MGKNTRKQNVATNARHLSTGPAGVVSDVAKGYRTTLGTEIADKCETLVKKAERIGFDISKAVMLAASLFLFGMTGKDPLDYKAAKQSWIEALSELLPMWTTIEVSCHEGKDGVGRPRSQPILLYNSGVHLDYGYGRLDATTEVNLAECLDELYPIEKILDNLIEAYDDAEEVRLSAVNRLPAIFDAIKELADQK